MRIALACLVALWTILGSLGKENEDSFPRVGSIGPGSQAGVGVNQHALLRINVGLQIREWCSGGSDCWSDSLLKQMLEDRQWSVSIDEISLTSTTAPQSSAPSLTPASTTETEASTSLVELEQIISFEWSHDASTLHGSASVTFLLPLLEDSMHVSSSRTLLVAVWEEDLSLSANRANRKKRRKRLVRRVAQIPKTRAAYDLHEAHNTRRHQSVSPSPPEEGSLGLPPALKPFTVVEIAATSRFSRPPPSCWEAVQNIVSFSGRAGVVATTTAVVLSFVFVIFATRRYKQRPPHENVELQAGQAEVEEMEAEADRQPLDPQEGEDGTHEEADPGQRQEEVDADETGSDQPQHDDDQTNEDDKHTKNQYDEDGWWHEEDDDQENTGSHVVENTQLLLAWAQRLNNASDDDELAPPPMERHVVRPMPTHGITFEDEIERFNQLELSSPLGSRAARSAASSVGRRRGSQRDSLHLPTMCGSPQPLAWDRPMLFNSPMPSRRFSLMHQEGQSTASATNNQPAAVTASPRKTARNPFPTFQALAQQQEHSRAMQQQQEQKQAGSQEDIESLQNGAKHANDSKAKSQTTDLAESVGKLVATPGQTEMGPPCRLQESPREQPQQKTDRTVDCSPATTNIDILELQESPTECFDNNTNIASGVKLRTEAATLPNTIPCPEADSVVRAVSMEEQTLKSPNPLRSQNDRLSASLEGQGGLPSAAHGAPPSADFLTTASDKANYVETSASCTSANLRSAQQFKPAGESQNVDLAQHVKPQPEKADEPTCHTNSPGCLSAAQEHEEARKASPHTARDAAHTVDLSQQERLPCSSDLQIEDAEQKSASPKTHHKQSEQPMAPHTVSVQNTQHVDKNDSNKVGPNKTAIAEDVAAECPNATSESPALTGRLETHIVAELGSQAGKSRRGVKRPRNALEQDVAGRPLSSEKDAEQNSGSVMETAASTEKTSSYCSTLSPNYFSEDSFRCPGSGPLEEEGPCGLAKGKCDQDGKNGEQPNKTGCIVHVPQVVAANSRRRRRSRGGSNRTLELPDVVPSISLVNATQDVTAPVWQFSETQTNIKRRKTRRGKSPCKAVLVPVPKRSSRRLAQSIGFGVGSPSKRSRVSAPEAK